MKFRLQMLQPNPLIARSPALQFKGALAQTRTKHSSQHLLHSEITRQKGQAQSICSAFGSSERSRLPTSFPSPQAEQQSSALTPPGKPKAAQGERATCSSNPRNHSLALRQENTRGKAVLATGRGTAGIWGTSVHPDSSLLPQPAR